MKPTLQLVGPAPETVAEKVRRLQAEAQGLAKDHVCQLLALMVQAEAVANEIAAGGGVYHAGCQELSGRIAQSLSSQRLSLAQIVERL